MDGNEKEISLVPYVELNGTRTASDNKMAELFKSVVDQKLLRWVFCEGHVRGPDEFLRVMKDPGNLVVLVVVGETISGFAWLNELRTNRATAHFCFLKDVWGKTAVKAGKQIIDYWFTFTKESGSQMFDVITGLTPANNHKAISFIKRMGFTILGEIPYTCHDQFALKKVPGVVSYKTRSIEDGR